MQNAVDANERKRILFSDDELNLGFATKLYLEAEGYEVRLEPKAREALEAARSWQPHLIVTDLYKYAPMAGLELLQWLKADEQTKDIPVLVLSSACNDPATRQEVLDAGAWAAWAKPFDPKDLLQAAKDLLGT